MQSLLTELQAMSGANPTLFYPILPGYCWQDTARTVPAGKDDPVRVYDDIGGLNHHMIASADGRRGILREDGGLWRIETDGTDDAYATAGSVNFSGTDKLSIFLALRKTSDVISKLVLEFSTSASTNAGAFYVSAPDSVLTLRYAARVRGSAASSAIASTSVGTTPENAVIAVTASIPDDLVVIRRNGVAGTPDTTDKGTGNYGSYRFFHAARNDASLHFPGSTYSYAVASGIADAGLITQAEAYFASRCGVTLP